MVVALIYLWHPLRVEGGEKLLYMNVCDTGHGIVTEDMEKIFDRFYQSKKSMKYPVYGRVVRYRSFPV